MERSTYMYMNKKIDVDMYMNIYVQCTVLWPQKEIDANTKKNAKIEKAITFFLEEIEQKFKQTEEAIRDTT